jgi:glycosyltransferase involved in cell wall biosynthesis
VSSIVRKKNPAALCEAIRILVDRGFPHALVLVGRPSPFEGSEAITDSMADVPPGRLLWLGRLRNDDLVALMSDADAFCHPALTESFGLTALEAMACQAPVVVADRGSLPEVVGDAGLLVEPTPEALADALAGVLSDRDLASRLRTAARQRAEQMTWERTAEGWVAALSAASANG